MRFFIYSLLSSALFFAVAAQADFDILSIDEVAVMQQKADGTYDVVCTNGNRETVTDLDLELNNVCPNKKTSKPSGILSLQRRADGDFDVVCRDLKKMIASTADLLAGQVCTSVAPPVVLEDGEYTDNARYFCDQRIKTAYNNSVLSNVSVTFINCGGGVEMTCKDNFCEGTTSSNYKFTLKVLNSKSYELVRVNDAKKATFVKK
ncbi:MAG: hypothetical protein AB7N80_08475 [Bdellovibrionales bacterium]